MSAEGPWRRVGEVLGELLERQGLGRPSRSALAVLRWAEFAGPAVAAHSRALHCRRGRLTVAVDSNVWATELSTLTPTLLGTIASALGEGVVTEIRFVAGRGSSTGSSTAEEGSDRTAGLAPGPEPVPLAGGLRAEQQQWVRRLAAQAGDPELAAALVRWFSSALKAGPRRPAE